MYTRKEGGAWYENLWEWRHKLNHKCWVFQFPLNTFTKLSLYKDINLIDLALHKTDWTFTHHKIKKLSLCKLYCQATTQSVQKKWSTQFNCITPMIASPFSTPTSTYGLSVGLVSYEAPGQCLFWLCHSLTVCIVDVTRVILRTRLYLFSCVCWKDWGAWVC